MATARAVAPSAGAPAGEGMSMPKAHVAVLPDASSAMQTAVELPTGKTAPDGGAQLLFRPGQLSDTVGGG